MRIFGKPLLIDLFYPKSICRIPQTQKTIYLTFDDGPYPEITERVLTILDKYSIKASFFVVGQQVAMHRRIFERIISEGHSVGNHTFSHPNGFKISATDLKKEIEKTDETIGFETALFRPPFGKLTPKQYLQIQKKIIYWSQISYDFDQDVDIHQSLYKMQKSLKNGDIILFHDLPKAEQNLFSILEPFIIYALKMGFKFKAIL